VKSACLGGAGFDDLWRRRCATLTGSMRGGRGNARLVPLRPLNVLVSPLLMRVDGVEEDVPAGEELFGLREH
jgi:hypothetical protein